MSKNKFNVGDVVLYQSGEQQQLGIVEAILIGKVIDLGDGTTSIEHVYCVCFETENITIRVPEAWLRSVDNAQVFTILRKQEDDMMGIGTCREMAAKLLSDSPYVGDEYYYMEDAFTRKLGGEKVSIDYPDPEKLFIQKMIEDRASERDIELLPEHLNDITHIIYKPGTLLDKTKSEYFKIINDNLDKILDEDEDDDITLTIFI